MGQLQTMLKFVNEEVSPVEVETMRGAKTSQGMLPKQFRGPVKTQIPACLNQPAGIVFGVEDDCQCPIFNTDVKKLEDEVLCEEDRTISTKELRMIARQLGLVDSQLAVYYTSNERFLVIYGTRKLAFQLSKVDFKKHIERLHSSMSVKYHNIENCRVAVIMERNCKLRCNNKSRKFKPQAGVFGYLSESISSIKMLYSSFCANAKVIMTEDFKLFFIDIIAVLVELRDGFLTPTKLVSVLMSIYTSYKRYNKMFVPQTLNVSDMLSGFMFLGLPTVLIDQIKTFTVLTGKRIFDSDAVMSVLSSFFQVLNSLLDFLETPTFVKSPLLPIAIITGMRSVLKYVSNSTISYNLMREVASVYTQYIKNPQEIFDPTFREKIVELNKKCIAAPGFIEFATNTSNKYFNTTWTAFRDNVVKATYMFDQSRRDEPLLFVFEGLAGSGKSQFMNATVDLLRKSGLSVYCHTVPSTEDAKDFYDDYENQDVFVMDDVGQQGKSQWRTMINFVSPIKYPLPCATASKKNTKFFNSKVILCTTNHLMNLGGFTSTDCITEPEALFRRCHVVKVEKVVHNVFAQRMRYYKFDHLVSHRWENALLHHTSSADVSVDINTSEAVHVHKTKESLKWFWKLFMHVKLAEERNRSEMFVDDDVLSEVLQSNEEFGDAVEFQPQYYGHINGMTIVNMLTADACSGANKMKHFIREWVHYYVDPLYEFATMCVTKAVECVMSIFSVGWNGCIPTLTMSMAWLPERLKDWFPAEVSINPLGLLVVSALALAIRGVFKGGKVNTNDSAMRISYEKSISKSKKDESVLQHKKFKPQSDERVINIASHVKLVVYRNGEGIEDEDEMSHGIVSGKYILLPSHMGLDEVRVDIYRTYAHYENKHKEQENIKLKRIRLYIKEDLAIYEMVNLTTRYKKCWNLFPEFVNKNPSMSIVTSFGPIPVIYGSSVFENSDEVKYTSYRANYKNGKQDYVHSKESGYYTPVSGGGFCGSPLVSADNGIVAFHIAGDGDVGFSVAPQGYTREDIRQVMLQGEEVNYDFDDKIYPGISGARLRYPAGSVKSSHPMSETSFVKSVFHTDVNSKMEKLVTVLESSGQLYTSVDVEKIDSKAPPNFKSKGAPKKLLHDISMKTFKHQGFIAEKELGFMAECIRSMIPTFNDLSDEVCAFGGNGYPAINKDSSNGYGCLKGKEAYFDFEKKVIKDEAVELFEEFASKARREDYDINMFLSVECFKDELRKSTKVDEPRTFRVMPLPHIWWTKKLCGELIPHFKKNMHKYGCCVGFNPYKDMDLMSRRLKDCAITGDIDFAKWDGSIMASIMDMIGEVLVERYQGSNVEVLKYVLNTMARSTVLVADELWATTHGLPSGTWLTLLMNCLINKALTALVLYRNKKDASIVDFEKVVDYVMGDDKVFGVPSSLKDVFNLLTVRDVAESLGMVCTNGDKTPIVNATQPFNKLNFVKRHMRQHPVLKRYVGVLSIDTIINTLQWVNSDKDVEEVMAGKMKAVQVEAFLHSESLFKEITSVMEDAYPYVPLFSRDRVVKILDDPEAYTQVMLWLGKDKSFLEC
jgi:hypothetical protein